jgi:hypothetical protein
MRLTLLYEKPHDAAAGREYLLAAAGSVLARRQGQGQVGGGWRGRPDVEVGQTKLPPSVAGRLQSPRHSWAKVAVRRDSVLKGRPLPTQRSAIGLARVVQFGTAETREPPKP